MVAKVSVIVPNYNHAPYLRQRLDSIFNQSFQDFEVIILDDCSTDNSKEIIEEYRNRPQVSHVVYNETNSGSPFKQWAKGFDLAQGEYIWIAESDDWAELNFLQEMVSYLNKDSSLAFAFCESYREYPNQSIEGRFLGMDTCFKGLNFIVEWQIYKNNVVNASSVVLRKSNIQSIPQDYQQFVGSGDYLFWSQLCECGNIYYVNQCLNHFRQNDSTTTSTCMATGKTFYEDYRIFEYFKSKGYVSTLALCRIIDYKLSQIEQHKDILLKNKCYNQCVSLWEKELKTKFLFASLFWFCYHQKKKFDEFSFLAKIWKFMHLPNTNLRRKLWGK